MSIIFKKIYNVNEICNFNNSVIICFNNIDDNTLPKNIINISFSIYYNNTINNLHNYIKYIDFYETNEKSIFNQNINNLPDELNTFLSGYNFNKLINNLPNKIIKISLESTFNNKLNNLPKSLINLIWNSTNIIKNMNPVKILEIGYKYNKTIDFIPEGIEILKLYNYLHNINDLPSSIKEIWIPVKNKNFINKMYWNRIKYY